MARKPTDQVQLKLRFDEKLRRKLAGAAAKNDRSMNSEIVARLEQSLRDEDILTEIRADLAELKRAMQATQEEWYKKFMDELRDEEDQHVADTMMEDWEDREFRNESDKT